MREKFQGVGKIIQQIQVNNLDREESETFRLHPENTRRKMKRVKSKGLPSNPTKKGKTPTEEEIRFHVSKMIMAWNPR